jgi:hypothetical protein
MSALGRKEPKVSTSDQRGIEKDNLQSRWLEEHSKKMTRLSGTLGDVAMRLDNLGETIDERVTSEEYLGLVRAAFRAWDRSETNQKREYVGNLVSNAAGTHLCSDDVVRLFVDWLDAYHEVHFGVMREIYKNPGSTRFEIWEALYGEPAREDSAEADLYRLLIRDLSTGGVIRQERDYGRWTLPEKKAGPKQAVRRWRKDDGVRFRRQQAVRPDGAWKTVRPLYDE